MMNLMKRFLLAAFATAWGGQEPAPTVDFVLKEPGMSVALMSVQQMQDEVQHMCGISLNDVTSDDLETLRQFAERSAGLAGSDLRCVGLRSTALVVMHHCLLYKALAARYPSLPATKSVEQTRAQVATFSRKIVLKACERAFCDGIELSMNRTALQVDLDEPLDVDPRTIDQLTKRGQRAIEELWRRELKRNPRTVQAIVIDA